jgi:hypothetical protein
MGLEQLRKGQIKYLENRVGVYSKLEYVSVFSSFSTSSSLFPHVGACPRLGA